MNTPLKHHEPLHFKADRRGTQRPTTTKRRYSERLYGSCQAIVRGVDEKGEAFTETITLDNVSASGLYVKLHHKMEAEARLFVVFVFSTMALQGVQAPRIAASGQVCRIDPLSEEITGIGLQFRRHRFV